MAQNNNISDHTNFQSQLPPGATANQVQSATEFNTIKNWQQKQGVDQGAFDPANITIDGTGSYNDYSHGGTTLALNGLALVTASGDNVKRVKITFSQACTVSFTGTFDADQLFGLPTGNIFVAGTYVWYIYSDPINSVLGFRNSIREIGGGSGVVWHNYNVWYVDVVNGSNGTAVKNDFTKPYQTVQAAYDARILDGYAGRSEIVIVTSGVYAGITIGSEALPTDLVGEAPLVELGGVSLTDVGTNNITFKNLFKTGNISVNQTGINLCFFGVNNCNNGQSALISGTISAPVFSLLSGKSSHLTIDSSTPGFTIDIANQSSVIFANNTSVASLAVIASDSVIQIPSGINLINQINATRGFINIGTSATVEITNIFNHEGVAFTNKANITVSGTETPITGEWYVGGSSGAPLETFQFITINEANKTDPIVLNATANIIEITLAADLTSDAKPSDITGWVKGRSYQFHFIKKGTYGFDGTDVVAANHIGYDDDINPFEVLIYINNTQQRAVIPSVGLSTIYGQFGRMLITGSNYTEI